VWGFAVWWGGPRPTIEGSNIFLRFAVVLIWQALRPSNELQAFLLSNTVVISGLHNVRDL
jgi:hypothetical protein